MSDKPPPDYAYWPLEKNEWQAEQYAKLVTAGAFDKPAKPHKRSRKVEANGHSDLEPFVNEGPPLEATVFVPRFKGAGDFIAEYVPISYTLEGILPSGVFYFLTGRRSTGKTAFMLSAAFAIAFNRWEIIGVDVTPGRIAYVALENPTDLRMKMAVYAWHFGAVLDPARQITWETLNAQIVVIDGRLGVKEVREQLAVAAEEGGGFQAIFWDTFQAGFVGSEFNQRRNFALCARPAHADHIARQPQRACRGSSDQERQRGGTHPIWRRRVDERM